MKRPESHYAVWGVFLTRSSKFSFLSPMNPKVDAYIDALAEWQEELKHLRAIVGDCGMVEDFKWMHPCYTFQGKNVVIIHEFKGYCAIMFTKGSLLKDDAGVLLKITENVQGARQMRFHSVTEVVESEKLIKQYIFEAIEVEKAGLKVEMKKTSDYDVPAELETYFADDPDYKVAFDQLTPGRQRGYLLHFAQPKQSATRTSRIEKSRDRVFAGKGIHDCICGLSKRMPRCDGSHKQLTDK